MLSRLRSNPTTRWVLLVWWCLAALAPTLAQAGSAWRLQNQPWAELCQTAAPADGERHDDGGQTASHQHCAACLLRLDPMAPAPSLPVIETADLPAQVVPAPDREAATPLVNWRRAQPRAPPLAA